jgi:hypothetical protein
VRVFDSLSISSEIALRLTPQFKVFFKYISSISENILEVPGRGFNLEIKNFILQNWGKKFLVVGWIGN